MQLTTNAANLIIFFRFLQKQLCCNLNTVKANYSSRITVKMVLELIPNSADLKATPSLILMIYASKLELVVMKNKNNAIKRVNFDV